MEIKLEGKKALVTGAGKGIGRAIAKKLVSLGVETFALSRTQSDLDSLKVECPSMNLIQVELADWDKTREAVEKIGPIDCLVNNAAECHLDKFVNLSKENLERTMDVNFKAAFNISQVIANGMVEKGQGGSIVNISSTASTCAVVDHSAYCPSKAALDMLTKCMALELGPHQIRVNVVNPTVVWTPMGMRNWSDPIKSGPMLARIPLGKFAEVDDVVNMVIFLLSDKSAMTTGDCVLVDGGYSVH